MAGRGSQLIAAALFALLPLPLRAGAEPATTPTPTAPLVRKVPMADPVIPPSELETVRRTLDTLTPEQRRRFKENLLRWMNLSPEEKKALREREEIRRNKMVDETEAALKETGLTLTTEQREQFVRRYGQERRLLEEKLRREMDEKRRPLVHEIIQRLREEFAASSTLAAPAKAAE